MKSDGVLQLRDLPTQDCIDDSEQMIEHGMGLIELLLEIEEILEKNDRLAISIVLSKVSRALNESY